jgi:hypothetical protein
MVIDFNKMRRREEFPSLPQQALNLTAAGLRAVGQVVKRQPWRVPPEIEAERQAVCAGCEENSTGRCRVCGCGVSAKFIRKTHLAAEQCPLPEPKWNKWTPQV